MRERTGGGRHRLSRALVAIVATTALAVTMGIIQPAPAAHADDYPSWQDVQAAIADVKANQALQTQVQAQIADLQKKLADAQADAQAKGEAYGTAQQDVDDQQYRVEQLQKQVDAATSEAEAARKQVDGLLHELAKPGGSSDLTSTLISHPGDADSLLYRLGAASQLTQTSQDLYAKAIEDQNTVQKLTDQASVAKTELERRRGIAQAAFELAQKAAVAAQAASDAADQHLGELQAQLVSLQTKQVQVYAGYQKGLEAAQAAAGAEVNLKTGWARPAVGSITSPFGWRLNPYWGEWSLHTGTDIGAGCGAPIRAAHAGTVVYAGPYSDLGNFLEIDHGNGYVTGYGHIANGGILVSIGQTVKAGQQVAKVGATGGATGCHLHFMVRTGGMFGPVQDPVPFMRSQGMPLG